MHNIYAFKNYFNTLHKFKDQGSQDIQYVFLIAMKIGGYYATFILKNIL